MNIVEAYLKFKKQTIILFSGLSGSNKSKFASFVGELFGYKIIKLEDFYYKDYDKSENYVQLTDEKILNWENIYESIDWKKFNEVVNSNKQTGIIISGFGFPSKLINFDVDFHIHVKINKKTLIETKTINENDLELLNKVSIPMNIKITDESKIDKFINVNSLSYDDAKEEIFDYLMHVIQNWLDKYNKNK